MNSENAWAINDANLQSYRNMCLSTQSIMLAVGAIFIEKKLWLVILLAVIAIIQIYWIWVPIIYYRGLIVDFYKFKLGELFDRDGNYTGKMAEAPLTDSIYCGNKTIRKKVNSVYSKEVYNSNPFSNHRATRQKIDIFMPVSITFVWILYIIMAYTGM